MNLKNLISLTASFFLVTISSLHAGVVSLTNTEVSRLQALVTSSPEAAFWKKSVENKAREALELTPNPVSRIQSEGQLEGSIGKTQTLEALKDMPRLQALGLAYALTGDVIYLNKTAAYLTAWAKTCQPTGDPIDATSLEPLLETYDLVRPGMAPEDRKILDNWVRLEAETLRSADNPNKEIHRNNWQAHRLKITAMAAFILNDPDLENQTLDSLKTFMRGNLNPDGTTLDFHLRDALHYQLYDLEPLIRTAMIYQRAQGVDLYNWKTDQGASVSRCVAFVLPYATGQKTHAEFVNSTVIFDRQRAANNEAEYTAGHAFVPRKALRCLELAQFFQPELKSLAGTLCGKPDTPYPTLQILLNEAMRSDPLPAAAAKDTSVEDYQLAYQDYKTGQYARAVSGFQKVVREKPDSWQGYQGLGIALMKTGDQNSALQALQKCLELNPNNPPIKAVVEKMESVPASTQPAAVFINQQPFFDDFNTIDPAVWTKQDYTWPDSASYDKPSQVTAQNSILTVLVQPAPTPVQGKNILAGGLMSRRLFTYGRFSAKMKNHLVPGLDNSFFLMSPWQAKGWRHQELDFEFLGKNPGQVQVNVHKYMDHEGTVQNGGELPKMIGLGFDSNQAYHVYTIEWLKDKINFYVDDKLVWTETHNLPDQGLNLFLGNFVVNQDNGWGPQWAGKFDPKTLPASVQFDWVKYEPLPDGLASAAK